MDKVNDEAFEDTPFGFDPITGEPNPDPKPKPDDAPAGDPAEEVDEPEEGAEPETLEGTLSALADALKEIPEAVGAAVTKAVAKTPAGAPDEKAAPSEIDAIMETLEDQPEELRSAVRTALERGARVETVLENMQQAANEESLVGEIATLSKSYPGLTEADVHATLLKLKELGEKNPALADELEILEEVAARAIGRAQLDSRRVKKAAAPSGGKGPKTGATVVPAGKPKPAAAQIVADATPGAGDKTPYDPGPGNDFSDIARHITAEAGESLVIRK